MERLAIFDLDGTLFNGRVWTAFVKHHVRQRVQRRATAAYVVRNMSRLGLYKLGLMDRPTMWDRFGREISRLLGGLDTATAAPMLERIYANDIAPKLDSRLLERWAQFGAEGYRRFIISGSPQPMLTVIGQHLGATAAFGTYTEQINDRYTGQITGLLCQADEKARRLETYVASQRWEVDWAASYSFADSYSDRVILELTGHPIAIRPDPDLRRHALAAGWEIQA